MSHCFCLKPLVDEILLDEDDRRALHFLKGKKGIVNLQKEVDDDSHAVLDMHRQKNRAIKPPKPHAVRSQGASFNVANPSQHAANPSQHAPNPSQHHVEAPCMTTVRPSSEPRSKGKENTLRFSSNCGNANVARDTDNSYKYSQVITSRQQLISEAIL
ncbi:hypothetical protein L208DRAFT_1406452, partial [Tricholoma matsutake]